MMYIHVLSPGFTNPNSIAFLFPLIRFQKILADSGYHIKIFNRLSQGITDCDVLLIEGKYFADGWSSEKYEQTLGVVSDLSVRTRVIWCDQSDSTGTFLGQVLPYVYKYAKAQILKDREEYLRVPYASRIYADYYHRNYGVQDEIPYIQEPVTDVSHLFKIRLSWNSGLMNYGVLRPYLMKLWGVLPFQPFLDFSRQVVDPGVARPLDVSCRMGLAYERETIRYQRRKLQEILSGYLKTDKVSHGKYLKELQASKISVSPFGYGEITLKDFETFLSGAALLKPDMSHMETWPDFYMENVTYVAHNWDLTDVLSQIEILLQDDEKRLGIAKAGQEQFVKYTVGVGAAQEFALQFRAMLKDL